MEILNFKKPLKKVLLQNTHHMHWFGFENEFEVWNIAAHSKRDAVDANAEGQNNSMRLIIKFQVDYFTWFMVNCLIGKLKIYTCYTSHIEQCSRGHFTVEIRLWCLM